MQGKRITALFAIFALLAALCLFAILAGSYDLSPRAVFEVFLVKFGLSDAEISRRHMSIVWDIRLPRILLAALAGVALSTAGTVYQGCFRNPLVEPYILGISSGAAFGTAMGIVFPHIFLSTQLSAFVFALAAVALAWFSATSKGETPAATLVLAGVIIGSVFTAFVSIVKYVSNDSQLREIVFWMMGGFYNATWADVRLNAPVTLLGFAAIFIYAWRLNVLSLGDEGAKSLGISPQFHKIAFILVATLIASVCVSTAGVIAWVGLMMPHAARFVFGPDNRWVLPASAFMGGAYMVLCDTIARTLTMAEIPIGIITSIIGAPYLIWLLRSKGKALFHG